MRELRVGVGVNVSNLNPPIWLETSVCDGADKVTKLIKQKEKAITRVHKKHEKIKLVTKLSKHSDYTVIWTSTPIYNFVK